MEREELIKSKEYWVANIQIAMFEMIGNYLKENKLTKTQLAEELGVTKGYVTQVLNGDFDHKISKLVELSLACNIAPVFNFVNLDDYVATEMGRKTRPLDGSKIRAANTPKIPGLKSPAKKKIRA
jgi:transcriptional regulator with XRE-family HTH domain